MIWMNPSYLSHWGEYQGGFLKSSTVEMLNPAGNIFIKDKPTGLWAARGKCCNGNTIFHRLYHSAIPPEPLDQSDSFKHPYRWTNSPFFSMLLWQPRVKSCLVVLGFESAPSTDPMAIWCSDCKSDWPRERYQQANGYRYWMRWKGWWAQTSATPVLNNNLCCTDSADVNALLKP